MLRASLVLFLLFASAVAASGADAPREAWQSYRSDEFGYALSFPPVLALRAYFGGQSATLVDAASGERLAELEVWPGGSCPPLRAGTTAQGLGTERAAAVTQADGPETGSVCDEARLLRTARSAGDVPYWELELACSTGGVKGPTFFADVSQPWRTRVLMFDPVGIDPRQPTPRHRLEPALVRQILDTLTRFAVAQPPGVCIEQLR